MSKGSFNTEVSAFWTWFSRHQSELDQVSSGTDPLLDVLLSKLQRIHQHLFFEVCLNSMPRELILTVEGRRELFPLVDAVVAGAGECQGWAIKALKPAMGFDFQTSYEGTFCDPKTLWFLPLERSGDPLALGIRIGVPALEPSKESDIMNAIVVILRTGLGERSASVDIHHVEVGALPTNPESRGYMELIELPKYINWRKHRSAPGNRERRP